MGWDYLHSDGSITDRITKIIIADQFGDESLFFKFLPASVCVNGVFHLMLQAVRILIQEIVLKDQYYIKHDGQDL
jgi:hypothetical protein